MDPVRREIALRGVVQGVGLRPFAARAARALGLAGEVANASWGVRVVLEGAEEQIDAWLAALRTSAPRGACIESLVQREAPVRGLAKFEIAASELAAEAAPTRIPPDAALCDACRDELFDPRDRRHRYAFTHCAACGPRASVARALPYDRARTTLGAFPPCAACRAEYDDPEDRRFHAETVACPACGPTLVAHGARGEPVPGDAVEAAAACLRAGGLVALKGYGGFHLACDATRSDALARLRARKARPVKPFALLVPDLATARTLVALSPADEAWLTGPARAVVLAPRRAEGCAALGLAPAVAPRTRDLGLLLPVAPLHWLLLHGPSTRPGVDPARFAALVFTSANASGAPTLHDDEEAAAELAEIADLVVGHDRAVARPSDDSIVRSAPTGPIPIRLSRATAPVVVSLPRVGGAEGAAARTDVAVLAVGADLKAAPAVLARGELVLGEHVGDLAHVAAADALEARAEALARLVAVRPAVVAHDLHPGYVGSELAARLAARLGARLAAVQHHHAHAAACLVEHGRAGPALALVLDGAGFGADGTIWGGELLQVTLAEASRLAHLEPVPLPGGDAAVREPWRMAFAWLRRAFPRDDAPRLPWHARRGGELAQLARAIERGVASPPTSSCGRLFDAVASLLDLGDVASHEGEVAMALESLAETGDEVYPLGDALRAHGPEGVLPVADLVRDLVRARAAGVPAATLARGFHAALAARLAAAVVRAAEATGLDEVALSGGCLQSRLLASALEGRLRAAGLRPLLHRLLPPNDGALAVGQAAVAAARGIAPPP
ncbi:MAG TPA: carbamoyltransferase HypF [Myxococcota bacterium]|nr:carbamoyltransferase HypF [Myxococcota bacterium]